MQRIPFAQKELLPEWIKRAEAELGETPEAKVKALREFRKLMNEQKDIRCRPDDIFLLRFIRLKKYDLEKAVKLCRNYYTIKHDNRGVYTMLRPSDVRNVIEMNAIGYLPYRLPWGAHIGVLRLGNFNWSRGTVHDLIAAIEILGEILLEHEPTQLFGACIFVDLKGVTFQNYIQFIGFTTCSLFIGVMQNSWPQRIDSIHLINEPFFCETAFKLLRPVLKKKTIKKMHFHGSSMDSLHKYAPKDILPEEYGGTLGPLNFKEFNQIFMDSEDFIEMVNSYGIIDQNRNRKSI